MTARLCAHRRVPVDRPAPAGAAEIAAPRLTGSVSDSAVPYRFDIASTFVGAAPISSSLRSRVDGGAVYSTINETEVRGPSHLANRDRADERRIVQREDAESGDSYPRTSDSVKGFVGGTVVARLALR